MSPRAADAPGSGMGVYDPKGIDLVSDSTVRIRHPLECLPYRPPHRSAWSPSRRAENVRRRVENGTYMRPSIIAASTLGAVRINFRYASFQSMAAAHSMKAGRDQYFEGPHETYGFRLHEVDPFCLDLQYQPITIEWYTTAGVRRHMTLDWAIETQDHRIVFGEDKATAEYFDDPDLKERLDFAQDFLERNGASLERRVAGGLSTSLRRRIVKDIFDARRTEVRADVAANVRALVVADGGTSTLARVMETIGEHPALSLDIARAMMHRRLLSMPISSPPMPDTPVTIPAPAKKGALRAFLAAHVLPEETI